MKTLILGGGGREDAIAHALAASPVIGELHAAPGNPGIARVAATHKVNPASPEAVSELCKELGIELVVVGPEAPLVAGVADELRELGIMVFGPGKDGAMLEGSKAYAKSFMKKHNIPTSGFDCCIRMEECVSAIEKRSAPYVIKADGLAGGKGVFLTEDPAEAVSICEDLISGKILGSSGDTIVIEDFVKGAELTVLALTDGEGLILLPASRDHKRAYDGDGGPNTGGMGAFCPVPGIGEDMMERIKNEIFIPTVKGLRDDDIPYCGVIYAGLMLTEDGAISLIEYNARMGDPETQAVLSSFGGDFGEAILACCRGKAKDYVPRQETRHSVSLVLASSGYPGKFKTGFPITGLDNELPDTHVFHAGTAYKQEEKDCIVTSGGRVLAVVGTGKSLEEARNLAYKRAGTISFEGVFYRKDIAGI